MCDDIERVFGDTAYGGATLRHDVKYQLGVEIVAPPPPANGKKNDGKKRSDFEVDFEKDIVTCPAGMPASSSSKTWHSAYRRQAPVMKWNQDKCDA